MRSLGKQKILTRNGSIWIFQNSPERHLSQLIWIGAAKKRMNIVVFQTERKIKHILMLVGTKRIA